MPLKSTEAACGHVVREWRGAARRGGASTPHLPRGKAQGSDHRCNKHSVIAFASTYTQSFMLYETWPTSLNSRYLYQHSQYKVEFPTSVILFQ